MNDEQQQSSIAAILKELSDIKASLAVNTSETANIKAHINEIKGDVRDIKAFYITRTEFEAEQDYRITHGKIIDDIQSKVWKAIGALAIMQIIILPVMMYLFYQLLQK